MFKTLLFATLALFSGAVSSTEKSDGFLTDALNNNEFAFKQPLPKVADSMYKEVVKAYAAGNRNAVFFLDHARRHWNATQQAQGLNEPEDVYMGCYLYQLGGLKALEKVKFVDIVPILAGGPKPDGSGDYTEADATKLVDSWSKEQVIIAFRLWAMAGEYAGNCYSYVHHGFIAGIPRSTST